MRDELLRIWPNDETIQSILDLGCRDCWHTTALPGVTNHVGVDAWPAALERGVLKGVPFFAPVLGDAIRYTAALPRDSFDAVLAIDLLEHLTMEQSEDLLIQMDRVARHLAVVWTTLGMIEQGPYDVDGQFNPFEEHKWGPTPEFFGTRGWQLRVFPTWHETRGGAILAWRSKS